ncbi:MAG: hypothetical protein A2538_02990 [Candidatus Magasanikbacteria bacterium RIFOXYD2_FULL_41_14]|uniref:Phosphatidic acid phosphatase type 2/haloperoxidase domain-containing protein n=1 Tax=Candidatus Magasanikbacteria bacterium RIFOXYD2_FULL_41_14 TaxID=1798709 RepID=A0A1F6PCW3_9BACT|nr:MAG: hypothetical protein A2538_02990 [Candidatus Magasanikbacteria bacterium RIFOXYD2_FULL_41_14]
MNWNARLYLYINKLSGRYHWLDLFSRAGAEWAIFGLAAWFGLDLYFVFSPNRKTIFFGAILFGAMWGLGMLISVLIGLVVKEPRPYLKHPEARLMFHPLSTWKSFPSDHAFAAFLFYFIGLVFGLPNMWAFLVLALWVGWGRVYAGVHYPFDIVGGASLAGLMAVLAYYLLVVVGLSF